MRRYLMSAAACLIGCMVFGGEPPAAEPRPFVTLAGEWQAQFVAKAEDAPGETWTKLALPGKTTVPKDMVGVWCQREVTVPADWQGRRVVVVIGHPGFSAAVQVNGQKAGELPGYGGELDVTGLVKLGQANQVRLFFGKSGAGVAATDRVVKGVNEGLIQRASTDDWGWDAFSAGVFCEPEFFRIESQNPDAVISDVWYKTFTRGYVRILPEVTLHAAKDLGAVQLRVVIREKDTGTVVRDETFAQSLAAGDHVLTLPVRGDNLKLWDIGKPNRHVGQVFLLAADGTELDRSTPVAFGIREFYTMGKDWYLNGNKMNFIFEWAGPDRAAIEQSRDKGISLLASNITRPGVFITRVHMEIPPVQAELCDELGIGLTYIAGGPTWIDLVDPQTLRDYRAWVAAHLKHFRNHPSILFWCIGMNTPGNYLDFSPTKIGREYNTDWSNIPATMAQATHKEFDSSRLTYFHGGPRGGDVSTGNIYFNHMPTQEIEDWLSEWAERGDRPIIAVEFMGSPLEVDYLLEKDGNNRVAFATEYLARVFGDRAYAEEQDDYVAYTNYGVPRLKTYWDYRPLLYSKLIAEQIDFSHRRSSRAWRFWGAPQFSWTFPYPTQAKDPDPVRQANVDKIAALDLELKRPVDIWLGGAPARWTEKDHAYFAGEQIEKSALVCRDLADRDIWTFAWEAKLEGAAAPLAADQCEQVVGPWARMKVPIAFAAPAVTETKRLTVTLKVTEKATGKEIATDVMTLTVHPRPAAPAPGTLSAAIIDPEGESTAWLSRLGVTLAPWQPGTKAKTLFIGRRGLKSMEKTLPFTPEDVAAGLRVVIFEQHCDDLGKLGFRHEDRCPRDIFLRDAQSQLATGLDNGLLHDWRGEATLIGRGTDGDRIPLTRRLYHWGNRGNVASNVIETPHHGPFYAIMDCEADLAYTPLLSWRHGQGEVVFCQLDLVGRVDRDPAATTVARNLVAYLAKPLPGKAQAKVAVPLGALAKQRLEVLGYASVGDGAALPAGLAPDTQVVVVDGAETAAVTAASAALAKFAADGGDIIVLGATAATLQVPLFKGLNARPLVASRGGKSMDANDLLRGVGPQNIHWREPLSFTAVAGEAPFVSLLGGLAGIMPLGQGRLILLQADPRVLEDFTAVEAADPNPGDPAKITREWRGNNNRRHCRWQMDRLASLVLANLGLKSSDELAKRLFEAKREISFTPINKWAYLGPFPMDKGTDGKNEDPLASNLDEFLKMRDVNHKFQNTRGERVAWYFPTDSQNGMGVGGKMDLSRIYGVRVTDLAIATTQIWSTRAREATVKYGADWWSRVLVNGVEIPGKGCGLERQGTAMLKPGWNDVAYICAAGDNGHWFHFAITNPGDAVEYQGPVAPAEPPKNLPPEANLVPEKVDLGFRLYTTPMELADDPYDFIPW